MRDILKKVQLSGALIVLICTVIGFGLEIYEMFNNRMITLPDLLLLFIYLEVLGMVTSFWGSLKVQLTYPLFIALTALARLIILQKKDVSSASLLYEGGAILLITGVLIATNQIQVISFYILTIFPFLTTLG